MLPLGATLPDSKNMFGAKDQVRSVRFLIGLAMAWGGNPERKATYLNFDATYSPEAPGAPRASGSRCA